VLEVGPDATPEQIRRAYKRLARRWHPDRNPNDPQAAERFREVAAAWAELSDPARRRRRRASPEDGALPEEFLGDLANAIDRAQTWLEMVVVPHYASRLRGRGAEMAAELWRDVPNLARPSWLVPHITRAGRRRARRWLREVSVEYGDHPRQATELVQLARGFRILVSPQALWSGGIRTSADLDDVVLRLLTLRYALVVGFRRVVPPRQDTEADWARALAAARRIDQQDRAWQLLWTGIYAGLAALLLFMFYSGFRRW
jgi:hypothetical protein